MPVIMLISVDLPLPDLPITATNSPAPTVRSDALERREIPCVGLVRLDDVVQLDEPVPVVLDAQGGFDSPTNHLTQHVLTPNQ